MRSLCFTVLCVVMMCGSTASANEAVAELEWLKGVRLFNTPSERLALNAARDAKSLKSRVAKVKKPKTKRVARPKPVQMQGLIKRSNGKVTVWVNGERSDQGKSKRNTVSVQAMDQQGRVKLKLGNQQTVNLKPGEVFDPRSRRVTGSYIQSNGQ